MDKLNAMQLFVRVAETGSFTAVADQLDVARSVVTRQISALEKSVYGADLVLESYQRQFEASRKTWQDLLNAVRELAQNQYALADANARLMGARHRLEIRMGQSPYSP